MQINIVDVRDVAEAHVRSLTEGEDMGRYLTVSGEMMMNDIAKSLKIAHPERKWTTWEAPYWLAIIASFSIRRSMWLGLGDIFENSTGMRVRQRKNCEWNGGNLESILDTTPPILENNWD